MKKFSKIVAGVLLATMTMLSACASAEQTKVSGFLLFAQDVEKVNAY